ncbi:MAG TPA: PLP-dependent transferase [Propionibacteriaceae bacterium]|nr:PLP-dependent transferase [Propionibacteriaceae bacterium]
MTAATPGPDSSTDEPVAAARGLRAETLAVAAGRPARVVDAPLSVPPTFAATYVGTHQPGSGDLGYGRYGNPTWSALEEAVGLLEGGRALAYSSGMAAAHAILELIPVGGSIVIPANCYLGVAAAVAQRAGKYGLAVQTVDVADTEAVLAAADGADMLWLESPTNPTIEVADLPAIGAGLKGGTMFVVDNTFATPLLQQPLRSGAHLVLHSATKFLSGHSDAVLGMVVVGAGDTARITALEATRKVQGAIPGTMESYLVLRGIRTLPVRLAQAQQNAQVLAERLSAHPAVGRVRYPGLPSDPGHHTASRVMAGYGSLLSIELADAPSAEALISSATLWVFATSLGGVESLFERRRRWPGELPSVPEGLIRLSVGIEHVEDLWDDLEAGLDQLAPFPAA